MRHRLLRVCLAGAALVVSQARPLFGGTIQLVISSDTVFEAGGSRTEVHVRNSGDEAIYDVDAHVEIHDSVGVSTRQGGLVGGASSVFTVTTTTPLPAPGTWPVVVRVRYRVGAGHTSEALHVTTASSDVTLRPSTLTVSVTGGHLLSTGSVAAAVQGESGTQTLRLRLIAPAGVSVAPDVFSIGANTPLPVLAQVKSSLVSHATLPIFCVAEFDDATGGHVSAVGSAMLEIGADDEAPPRPWAPSLLVATLVAWAAYAWRSRRRVRSHAV